MVKENKKTGKSDFSPSEASDAKRKRRRIYFDLDESMAKGKKFTKGRQATASKADMSFMKEGGLAEATAKLKAKGLKEGGMVVKDKVVAIDKSPNSGLITTKGFGAGRRT